ncbi:hypothetical protein HK096_007063, partial [Nowakowskiella sp. JEL0078]
MISSSYYQIISSGRRRKDPFDFAFQKDVNSINSINFHSSILENVLDALDSQPRKIEAFDNIWSTLAKYVLQEFLRDPKITANLSEEGLLQVLKHEQNSQWKTKLFILVNWMKLKDMINDDLVNEQGLILIDK